MPAHSWENTKEKPVYDISIINPEDKTSIKEEYSNSTEWQAFAELATKKSFFKG